MVLELWSGHEGPDGRTDGRTLKNFGGYNIIHAILFEGGAGHNYKGIEFSKNMGRVKVFVLCILSVRFIFVQHFMTILIRY